MGNHNCRIIADFTPMAERSFLPCAEMTGEACYRRKKSSRRAVSDGGVWVSRSFEPFAAVVLPNDLHFLWQANARHDEVRNAFFCRVL